MTPDLFTNLTPASRRILCVRLRNWPIDRLRRRRRAARRDEPAARDELAIALIDQTGNRRLVAAACARARALGVRPGIDQAEANAICPSLTCLPYDPIGDARGLRSLGRWMMRFTPVVSVMTGPEDPLGTPDALMMDVTGCERVFRGLENLVRQVVAALERFGLDARVALGSTVGAAWALTFAQRRHSLSPVLGGEGRGEGPAVEMRHLPRRHPDGSLSDRRDLGVAPSYGRPLTPTLSPAYRGEGVCVAPFDNSLRSPASRRRRRREVVSPRYPHDRATSQHPAR